MASSTPRRILFAISDTGGGHRSAAEAMVVMLNELAGDSIRCDIVDVLRLTDLPLLRSAPELYQRLSAGWMPLYDAGFALSDGPRRARLLLEPIFHCARQRLLAALDHYQPDLIVATHPFVVQPLAMARRYGGLRYRLVSVVTDLVSLHAAWACPDVDRCIVPTPEALELLLRRGMPATRLALAGFPVHPKFHHLALSRSEARRALGLDEARFTLLLTGGGGGAGQLAALARRLHRHFPDFQLLIVAGRNQALHAALQRADLGPHTAVYGYVGAMERLMAASDLVIGKAGPGTLMEALAVGRPMLVTAALGRQERGNIEFLHRHGLGLYCPTPARLLAALRLLALPEAYQAACARLNREALCGPPELLSAQLLGLETAGAWI